MTMLLDGYRGLVCDLDGVVYRGPDEVPHAVRSLNDARSAGRATVFATNNASRPPDEVGSHLRELGLEVEDDFVLNSSTAGARWLLEHLEEGSKVMAVGGQGVAAALRAAGFDAVPAASVEPGSGAEVAAVLQGYGSQVSVAELTVAAYAIQGGATWVATNTDRTLPTQFGIAPGNGTMIAAVRAAVGVDPVVVGKPGPLLYELAAAQLGTDAETTLGIGDRLETDTAGAHAAGMDELHVLTGVHGPSELAAAPPGLRPRYVAPDLRALFKPYDEPQEGDSGTWAVGAAQACLVDGRLRLERCDDPVVGLRVALRVLWQAVDHESISPAQAREIIDAARLDLSSRQTA